LRRLEVVDGAGETTSSRASIILKPFVQLCLPGYGRVGKYDLSPPIWDHPENLPPGPDTPFVGSIGKLNHKVLWSQEKFAKKLLTGDSHCPDVHLHHF
jgi:hypothetical protein